MMSVLRVRVDKVICVLSVFWVMHHRSGLNFNHRQLLFYAIAVLGCVEKLAKFRRVNHDEVEFSDTSLAFIKS